MSGIDELWRIRERTSADKVRSFPPDWNFYDHFERPVVLPEIVGFAGLDPARKGSGCSVDEIAVDGGNIGEE